MTEKNLMKDNQNKTPIIITSYESDKGKKSFKKGKSRLVFSCITLTTLLKLF